MFTKLINKKIFLFFNLKRTMSTYTKSSSNDKLNNYLYTIGNRISDYKLKLREETHNLFPHDEIMLTEITEGELLKMLIRLINPKVAIEIGVFTGYSSICIAEGLSNEGKLYASDLSKEFTDIARKYWKIAGVEEKIELNLKPGLEFLDELIQKKVVVDFAFVDADKPNHINYYHKIMEILRPGGVIVFDNSIWFGKVLEKPKEGDLCTIKLHELNLLLNKDKRVEINQLALSDGVTIVRKI